MRIGLSNIGVTKSSMILDTSDPTLVAISSPTATPTTLYWARNSKNPEKIFMEFFVKE